MPYTKWTDCISCSMLLAEISMDMSGYNITSMKNMKTDLRIPATACSCFHTLVLKWQCYTLRLRIHVSNPRSELQSSLEYTDVFNIIKRQCQKVICVILKYNSMAHLRFIWTGDNYEQLNCDFVVQLIQFIWNWKYFKMDTWSRRTFYNSILCAFILKWI